MNKKSKKNKYTILYLILIIIIGTVLIILAGYFGMIAGVSVINKIVSKNYIHNKTPILKSENYLDNSFQNQYQENNLSEFDYSDESSTSGCGCGE